MKRPLRQVASSLAALSLGLAATPACAWGPLGHRISAELAERNLDGKTRAEVTKILGAENLADASTWPDDQKSNPDPFWQKEASPWHYVTLPEGMNAADLHHPAEGDAATALERFTATLRNPDASQQDKARALRFIVHIAGDLHMPLHVGNGTDRGGNDFHVLWFDEPVNLHWVWDEGLIQKRQLSYTEYADRLERAMTPDETIAWWDAKPADWMAESVALRDRIYPATSVELGDGTEEAPVSLSWQYAYDWTPAMEQRLEQAGIRIAAYLQWVFADQTG
ncbi:S1/P1 nuclease [Altericroceibacterium endophyticum]|uniref:S1/P1 Nuclease n=1 Tax=Altericroceibacterium endophyticum TaxID=1808508 RepID=A0A6I4T1S9_9SPHN|nr:S1/P1 nuclease [Altericroceibacterium endophyticum]MXO64181.1 S1/P1 Nuclease [Altericroceibacterium endophyticum]